MANAIINDNPYLLNRHNPSNNAYDTIVRDNKSTFNQLKCIINEDCINFLSKSGWHAIKGHKVVSITCRECKTRFTEQDMLKNLNDKKNPENTIHLKNCSFLKCTPYQYHQNRHTRIADYNDLGTRLDSYNHLDIKTATDETYNKAARSGLYFLRNGTRDDDCWADHDVKCFYCQSTYNYRTRVDGKDIIADNLETVITDHRKTNCPVAYSSDISSKKEPAKNSTNDNYFKEYKNRFDTFKDRKKIFDPISTFTLAKAGFYYIGDGYNDKVTCFSCNKGLEKWQKKEPVDDPFEEHARHSPQCEYLKASKGQSFIDQILKRHETPNYQSAKTNVTPPPPGPKTKSPDQVLKVEKTLREFGYSQIEISQTIKRCQPTDHKLSFDELLEAALQEFERSNPDLSGPSKKQPSPPCQKGKNRSKQSPQQEPSRALGKYDPNSYVSGFEINRETECIICMEAVCNMQFLPCKCIAICNNCADTKVKTNTKCPTAYCDKQIVQIIKL